MGKEDFLELPRVPPSLAAKTSTGSLLNDAEHIFEEDSEVARVLLQHAYSSAETRDPDNEGRGVLQFKTQLHYLIKNTSSTAQNTDIKQDIMCLWDFYKANRCKYDSSTKRIHKNLNALPQVIEELIKKNRKSLTDMQVEEIQFVLAADNEMIQTYSATESYNIVPLDKCSTANGVANIQEIKSAVFSLLIPSHMPTLHGLDDSVDVFDVLAFVFCFQKDNVRNQRENLVLLLANTLSRQIQEDDGTCEMRMVSEDVVDTIFMKLFENYVEWCKYVGRKPAWEEEKDNLNEKMKLMFIALFFLIWGEAANLRFMPECLSYIFHNMVLELCGYALKEQIVRLSKSCDECFLDQIISPMYAIMAKEAANNDGGKASHSAWRNYDDFNEYFWSAECFALGWPWNENTRFFLERKKDNCLSTSMKKTSFVEHRTYLHLYDSFHRLWIFLVMMFQCLVVLGFHDGKMDGDAITDLLSIGPTFAGMKFVKSFLDMVFLYGAYATTNSLVIARILFSLVLYGGLSFVTTILYVKIIQESEFGLNTSSIFFTCYVVVLGAYIGIQVLAWLVQFISRIGYVLQKCHTISSFVDRMKRFYGEQCFVGRELRENGADYCKYMLFWVLILGCKFCFAYFLQVKPLVEPTRDVMRMRHLKYSWPNFLSKDHHNVLLILSFWASVFAIYLLDIHVWYTVLSALVGGLVGARDHLGEIQSIKMIRKRFSSVPQAFATRMVANQKSKEAGETSDASKAHAEKFSPFWNEIINCLREEDYINNREKDLLVMPETSSSFSVVQWPLFLLTSKVFLAVEFACEYKDSSQKVVWDKIMHDEYVALAVKESYYSLERILKYLFRKEGKVWAERLFYDVEECIGEGSLLTSFHVGKVHGLLSKISALTGLLVQETCKEKQVIEAMEGLYDAVICEIMSPSMRQKYESWNLIARARLEGSLFSEFEWPEDHEIVKQIKRLHLLLTIKESASNIPKNLEARRRLEFFTNSVFMKMAPPKPIKEMMSFSVFTPYYSETVMYSVGELQKENEDGISVLFYLQKIFPDEWRNFLERIGKREDTLEENLKLDSEDLMQLRLWASYRGQTLARTVRGMMYYRKAIMLQSYMERFSYGNMEDGFSSETENVRGFEDCTEAKALVDMKFTYVVTCQIYGQQKQKRAAEAEDIAFLLKRNESLRVAYIDIVDVLKNGKVQKEYYSKLVKADADGNEVEIFSIRLPGDPKLGEGKPENQNHAIIFTRGEAIQTVDMNQDNYFEEALKMRNLLEEFKEDHGVHPPTILGIREHIFTGSVSSLAWFMSNQETSFVTLGQRVLASPLKVRMHYGHPDVFDRVFHITRGGISKASRIINISEDIFAGFNSTLRRGNITHHEYIQVGKGRDVGLNQIALFEGKVAGGNGEQVLSRDVYRLGQFFDFFRMLSFYFTTVGFYFCTLLTVLTLYIFLYGKAYLVLSGLDHGVGKVAQHLDNASLLAALNTQFFIQIGMFTAVPMLMGFILEQGLLRAVVSSVTMQLQLCSVFFTFSLGTRAHYFGRTILHGGAKYRATGRGFVVRHIKFAENYRMYLRSHFVKGMEIVLLLIVYAAYGYIPTGTASYILITFSSWFLALSWLFAPYIFNPSGFEWQKSLQDFEDWTEWLMYKGGVGIKAEESWETWWQEENSHIRTMKGKIMETILSLRFFFFQYGIVYKLNVAEGHNTIMVYALSWMVLAVAILLFKIFTFSKRVSVNYQMLLRFFQSVIFACVVGGVGVAVGYTRLTIADLFACVLAFLPTGWGFLCVAVTWKALIKWMGLWKSVKAIARLYDAGIGMLLFIPIAFLSWFPFVSTFQSRLLFNQAFSRGLQISLILAGNNPNADY